MHAAQSAQTPSRTCMKGAGFEISRLAIDEVQKYAVYSSMWYLSI